MFLELFYSVSVPAFIQIEDGHKNVCVPMGSSFYKIVKKCASKYMVSHFRNIWPRRKYVCTHCLAAWLPPIYRPVC